MSRIQASGIALIIIHCLLVKNIRCQPFYYEDENAYYPDVSSSNEMYSLDPVEHNQDGSMRALAGVIVDKGGTTAVYYDETQNDVKEGATYSSAQNSIERTSTSYNHNFRDVVTTTVKHQDSDKNFEDSSRNSFVKSMKNDDTQPDFVRLQGFTASNNETTLRQSNQTTENSVADRKQNKTAKPNSTRKYVAKSTPDFVWENNSTLQSNLHMMFGSHSALSNVSAANNSFCDTKTHAGCDVTHHERCNPVTRRCRCLNGFFPASTVLDTGPCKAASFYHGHVRVGAPKPSQKFSDDQIQSLKQRLKTLIGQTLMKQGLDTVLDLNIRSVEMENEQTSLTFELGLNKEILPGDYDIHNLTQNVAMESQGEFLLYTSSELFTSGSNGSSSTFSPLVEVNPCVSSEHNHCSQHASCMYTSGTVSCQCNQGYEDPTPSVYRLPGELCVEKCICHNGGLCVDTDAVTGTRQCSCLNWYFGAQCQVDGRELLLICCCSLGSVVILCLVICCCYYGCIKHKDNTARSSMFSFSPDINILKLPRVWMDTTSYNDHELSPPDPRRVSVTSERNPYFDGYILEDISMGTLPRQGDNRLPYHQVSQTSLGHCPGTMSSHSFYRY